MCYIFWHLYVLSVFCVKIFQTAPVLTTQENIEELNNILKQLVKQREEGIPIFKESDVTSKPIINIQLSQPINDITKSNGNNFYENRAVERTKAIVNLQPNNKSEELLISVQDITDLTEVGNPINPDELPQILKEINTRSGQVTQFDDIIADKNSYPFTPNLQESNDYLVDYVDISFPEISTQVNGYRSSDIRNIAPHKNKNRKNPNKDNNSANIRDLLAKAEKMRSLQSVSTTELPETPRKFVLIQPQPYFINSHIPTQFIQPGPWLNKLIRRESPLLSSYRKASQRESQIQWLLPVSIQKTNRNKCFKSCP